MQQQPLDLRSEGRREDYRVLPAVQYPLPTRYEVPQFQEARSQFEVSQQPVNPVDQYLNYLTPAQSYSGYQPELQPYMITAYHEIEMGVLRNYSSSQRPQDEGIHLSNPNMQQQQQQLQLQPQPQPQPQPEPLPGCSWGNTYPRSLHNEDINIGLREERLLDRAQDRAPTSFVRRAEAVTTHCRDCVLVRCNSVIGVTCRFCGDMFVDCPNQYSHKCRHDTSLPYLCRYCKSGFPNESDCQIHELGHTFDAELFSCSSCKNKFATRELLTDHVLSHCPTTEPVLCEYCGLHFKWLEEYQIHLQNHGH